MASINLDENLVLESDLSSITQIERLIDSQSQMLSIDDEVYGKYLLAAVESINNAIVHGNNMDKSKKVFVHFSISSECIVLTVRDEGEGFDPDALPDPTATENIDKECGRGVFLMRHLSDELTFSNGGREVTMTFKLK